MNGQRMIPLPVLIRENEMMRLEAAERSQVDDVRQRPERLAARFVVFAGQSAKTVRIGFEMNAHASLIFADRRLAACAPRPAWLLAAKRSVKRHETSPERPPLKRQELHEKHIDPRPIWSQLLLPAGDAYADFTR